MKFSDFCCTISFISIYLISPHKADFEGSDSKRISSDNFFMKVIFPLQLQTFYPLSPAKIGPTFNTTFTDGMLYLAQPEHACVNLHNSKNMTGKVALVIRGGCSFVAKAINCQLAGAVAVIVYDYSQISQKFINMVSDDTGRNVHIPAAFMNGADGHKITSTLSHLNLDYATVMFPLNTTGLPMFQQKVITWTLW